MQVDANAVIENLSMQIAQKAVENATLSAQVKKLQSELDDAAKDKKEG